MTALEISHIEIVGSQPPYNLRIELSGSITEAVDDSIVQAMHDQEAELAVATMSARRELTEVFRKTILEHVAAPADFDL